MTATLKRIQNFSHLRVTYFLSTLSRQTVNGAPKLDRTVATCVMSGFTAIKMKAAAMKGKETPHYLHFVQTKMQQDESVLGFMDGWIGEMMGKGKDKQHNGCFILTRKRAIFCRKGLLGDVFQAIPLDKISSVETLTRMGQRILTLHASHDEMRFKTFEAADLFEQTYNQIEALRHLAAKAPTSPAPAPDTPLDMLTKLGALRDAGVLTSGEFEAKKRDLLAKI